MTDDISWSYSHAPLAVAEMTAGVVTKRRLRILVRTKKDPMRFRSVIKLWSMLLRGAEAAAASALHQVYPSRGDWLKWLEFCAFWSCGTGNLNCLGLSHLCQTDLWVSGGEKVRLRYQWIYVDLFIILHQVSRSMERFVWFGLIWLCAFLGIMISADWFVDVSCCCERAMRRLVG